jgi:hypothetical protein
VVPGVKKAAPMTGEDIADIIKAFADAGAVAKAFGFDGVELHGLMITPLIQIFWQGTNQQANASNGDMKARRGFAEEILKRNQATLSGVHSSSLNRLHPICHYEKGDRIIHDVHVLLIFTVTSAFCLA